MHFFRHEFSTLHFKVSRNKMHSTRSGDKFFKTLAKLVSSLDELGIFTRPIRKQLAKKIERVSEMGKKLARLASGFASSLANPEFYSHLASWRVVICTSDST
jgi:hypothetical protein